MMQRLALNVGHHPEQFVTACEDLKRFGEEIQKLKALEFPSRDIIEKLVEKCQKAYNDKIYQLLDMYSKENNVYPPRPWIDTIYEFNRSVRDDLKSFSVLINSLNITHGKLDNYKDEKDEKITSLESIIKDKDTEISDVKAELHKLHEELDSKNEEIKNKNKEIEKLKQNLAEKVIAIEHMKQDIINECIGRMKLNN